MSIVEQFGFTFPEEAKFYTSDANLREAIYKAFGGIDFYTRKPISKEEMVIDHIIPRAKGGPDNVYNYVPTTEGINLTKTDKVDEIALCAVLSIVRTSYAERVLRILKQTQRNPKQKRVKGNNVENELPKRISCEYGTQINDLLLYFKVFNTKIFIFLNSDDNKKLFLEHLYAIHNELRNLKADERVKKCQAAMIRILSSLLNESYTQDDIKCEHCEFFTERFNLTAS